MYFGSRNKNKYWKMYLSILALIVLGGGVVFGQNPEETELPIEPYCPPHTFNIVGPDAPKIAIPTTYRTISTDLWSDVKVTYKLLQGERTLATSEGSVWSLTFDEVDAYTLQATVVADETCTYELSFPLHAYTTIYTYIGPVSDEVSFAQEAISNTGMLLKELVVTDDSVGAIDQKMSTFFSESSYYIQHADSLLIDSTVLGSFLDHSSRLQQFLDIDLSQKDVYVFADISQSAFRRMTARYRELVGIETVHIVEKRFVGSFLTPLLLERPVDNLDFVKVFSTSLADSNKRLPVSYLVDYLLQGGFPIDTLVMIMIVIFFVLVISFAAQVVGLNVFGVFHPLMFGLSLYILGPALTILLIIAAFITMFLIKKFTDKVYLLTSAKVSLTVGVYCVICLLLFGVERVLGYQWIDYTMLQTPFILFPFLFLVVIGKTVFSEKFYSFGKGQFQGLLEFIMMSLIVYRGVQWTALQNFLLGYPEVLILVFILLIVVGRFTGLQLFEYVRFFPLIREYFDEEEE